MTEFTKPPSTWKGDERARKSNERFHVGMKSLTIQRSGVAVLWTSLEIREAAWLLDSREAAWLYNESVQKSVRLVYSLTQLLESRLAACM